MALTRNTHTLVGRDGVDPTCRQSRQQHALRPSAPPFPPLDVVGCLDRVPAPVHNASKASCSLPETTGKIKIKRPKSDLFEASAGPVCRAWSHRCLSGGGRWGGAWLPKAGKNGQANAGQDTMNSRRLSVATACLTGLSAGILPAATVRCMGCCGILKVCIIS